MYGIPFCCMMKQQSAHLKRRKKMEIWGEKMEYCFSKLRERVISALDNTDLEALFRTLKEISGPSVVAGVGFLIHGILNLYVYILSRSETIKGWHQGFLHDRYIAEILRVLIHFEPYGINLNLRKLCGDNQRIYTTVMRMTGKSESGTRDPPRVACISISQTKLLLRTFFQVHLF